MAISAAVFLLLFSGEVRNAVSEAINDCLEIIVPSLFAFSALAVYLQKSGLYKTALKPIAFPLSKILKTDEEICGIFLLANIGGYPVGASLLTSLVRENKLSRNDAARLMCCCFGSGPSFIIGMVGKVVFNSTAAGAAIFAACFLSSLVMALIFGRKIRLDSKTARFDLSAECFINSVSAAARAMFSVCTMIVIFSVISAALKEIGVFKLSERIFSVFGENSQTFFASILEITRIKEMTAGENALPVCAGLLSFGGVCVALQVMAISGGKIPLGRFMLSRIFAGALSALFASVFVHLIPSITEETLAGNVHTQAFSSNAALSVCLLAMCGLLLLGERNKERKGWF